ncbi:MAG TPA: 30S ribosomal protein S18 [Fibrobacteria bacterium]|jgi:small subunit ribosomal protein S18|nr:30S ribosomal protein S18 [Fibrobacteria bacterium]
MPMRERDNKKDGKREAKVRKRKTCWFTENKIAHVDYKDEKLLRRFINERGKIVSRKVSGTSARHQRELAIAVKRARHLALLPFVAENMR